MYYVYIVKCSDETLYTGIAKNLEKRIKEHNESDKGAKYTRNRRPVDLVYFSEHSSKSEALKEEFRIKELKREEKQKLFS